MPSYFYSPSQPSPPSEEKNHYENVSSFLKWALGISGSLIAIIISVGLFVSYKDRQEMKEDYDKTITDLKSQIKEMKDEAKETQKLIKSDLKDQVATVTDISQKQIESIEEQTNLLALSETRRQIDAIFQTTKIQSLIETEAVNEVKEKLTQIVKEQTQNDYDIQKSADDMRNGLRIGEIKLRRYFTNPASPVDSAKAKLYYDEIAKQFDLYAVKYFETENPFIDYYNNGYQPTDTYLKESLKNVIDEMNNPETSLNRLSVIVYGLAKSMRTKLKCFETDSVNQWYKRLK